MRAPDSSFLLKSITCLRSYLQVSLNFLAKELAFESLEETLQFLVEHSADIFTNKLAPDTQKTLECRQAHSKLLQAFEEKYRKVMIKGAI